MLRFALALCLIFLTGPGFAQDTVHPMQQIAAPERTVSEAEPLTPAAIGTVIESEGTGNIILRQNETGNEAPAQNGALIYPGDLVKTGEQAKLLILFIDNSRFTLGENAQLQMNHYIYDDQNPSLNKAHYHIAQGPFLYAGGSMSKDIGQNNIRIQTPYGTLNLRESTVWGGVLDNQYSVFVANGEAVFETNRGRIRIPGGEGTNIRSLNTIPERPVIWSVEKIDHAKENITLKNIESVKESITATQATHPDMLIRHKAHRNAARQDRIEQQTPKDSIKRLDNLPPSIQNKMEEPLTAIQAPEMAIPETTQDNIEEVIQESGDETNTIAPQPNALIEETPETPLPIEQKDSVAPEFPAMPPAAQPVQQQDLPSDPAMRQEALEKLNMHNESTHNPL